MTTMNLAPSAILPAGTGSFEVNEDCMRDYTIVVTITPIVNGKETDDLIKTFTIPAHPLTLSFEDLVSALTCNSFDLKDLDNQVPRTVLAAALGDGDPCSVISNTNGGTGNDIPNPAGYNWQVIGENSRLVLRAAKGEKVDDTTELFRIEFPPDKDGKSYLRVWVKDADSYQGKSSQDVCNDMKEWIRPSGDYRNYLLNVKVYGHECEGLQRYGTAFQQSLDNMMRDWWKIEAAYSVPCAITIVACSAGLGVFTGGTTMISGVKSALFDCTIAPAITMLGYKLAQSRSLLEGHSSVAWILGAGSPASVGVIRTGIEIGLALHRISTLQKIAKGNYKTVTPDEIRKLAKDTANLLRKLDKLGVLNVKKEDIETLDLVAKMEGTATRKTTELQQTLKEVDWKNIQKDIKNWKTTVTSRSSLASFGCRIFGGLAGTVSWYNLVETGLRIDTLYIDIENKNNKNSNIEGENSVNITIKDSTISIR